MRDDTLARRARLLVAPALLLALAPPAGVRGQAAEVDVRVSSDTTVTLDGEPRTDEEVVLHVFAGGITTVLDSLPSGVAVDAYDDRPGNGHWLSLDQVTTLAGTPLFPADVFGWDGSAVTGFLIDALVLDLRAGIDVDAVTRDGDDVLVSFATTVEVGGVTAADEDLVRWDGASWSLAFDGSAVGVPAGLGIDAAHRLDDGHLLLSFDGSGTLGGVAFDDEDVLEHDPVGGTWELSFDGSAVDPGWAPADLDALFALPAGLIFADGFESGDTSFWSATVGGS